MRKELIEQLKYPDNWELQKHTIQHRRSGMKLWTSNGFWFLDTDPGMKAFSLLDKIICWPHVRAVRKQLFAKWLSGHAQRLAQT